MTSAKAIRWAFICLLAVLAVLWTLNAANNVLSYIPFTSQWNERRAAAKVPGLEAEVSKLTREAQGNAEIDRATDTYHTREIIIREGTAQSVAEGRDNPDAANPLSPLRADQLGAHDRFLCNNGGHCPAPADAAGGGAEALPAGNAPG